MGVADELIVARRRRCPASPPPHASISPRKPHARDPCYYSDRLLGKQRRRHALLRRLLERVGELDQLRFTAGHPREADAVRGWLRVEPGWKWRRRGVGHHRERHDDRG